MMRRISNSRASARTQAFAAGTCLQVLLTVLQVVGGGAAAQTSAWTALSPSSSPSVRAAHDMAYDAQSDRIVLFGGLDGSLQVLEDTWAYDFQSDEWTEMNPVTAPSARSSLAMAYDAAADRVILFGGVQNIGGSFVEANDTWAYDFDTDTWTNRSPAVAPSPRLGHRMVYDAHSDVVILVGGHRGRDPSAVFLNDTWSYDFDANVWSERTPALHAGGGNHGGLVYHAPSDQMILFGGSEAAGSSQATWAYDAVGDRWTELRPAVAPSPRFLVGMAHDTSSNRVVLFGGTSGATETWTYHVEGNQWTQLDVAPAPSGRNGHRMAYDAQSDRTILFGGGDGLPGTVNNETWSFDLESPQEFPWLLVIIAAVAGTSAAVAALLLLRRRRRRMAPESTRR